MAALVACPLELGAVSGPTCVFLTKVSLTYDIYHMKISKPHLHLFSLHVFLPFIS